MIYPFGRVYFQNCELFAKPQKNDAAASAKFLKIAEMDRNCLMKELMEPERALLNLKMPNFGRGLYKGGFFCENLWADPPGSDQFLRQNGDQAVGGESEDAEEEVAGDFGSTAHSHESTSPVVFEVGVHPLDRGAFLETGFFMGGESTGVGAGRGQDIGNTSGSRHG